ncbi:MAG: hypothetical protein HQ517_00515 [SAR324 cluster bacterium]|nr:hypothetical protein [SAR324 cluster bacterium]
MKSLQVRDVPDHLYQKLLQEAKRSHRSLAQQTLATLSQGLKTPLSPKDNRRERLLMIQENALTIDSQKLRDPLDLIREDRDR